jgi:hypothetical protein
MSEGFDCAGALTAAGGGYTALSSIIHFFNIDPLPRGRDISILHSFNIDTVLLLLRNRARVGL